MIPQDCVRREMLWVNDTLNNPAINLIENLVMYGHENCEFTILEGILYSHTYRDVFEKIKELFPNRFFAYYFDLPFEETLSRHKQKTNSCEFGETEMRRWWREKDYFVNLCEKSLTKDMSLDQIVELIYQDIKK